MSRLLSVFKDLVCLFLGYFLVGNFIWVFFLFLFLEGDEFLETRRPLYLLIIATKKKSSPVLSRALFCVVCVHFTSLSLFFLSLCLSVCVSVCLCVRLSVCDSFSSLWIFSEKPTTKLGSKTWSWTKLQAPSPPQPRPLLRVSPCVCVCVSYLEKQTKWLLLRKDTKKGVWMVQPFSHEEQRSF